jgi:hypothetical protein
MLGRVALVRTDVSAEGIASIIGMKTIGELGTKSKFPVKEFTFLFTICCSGPSREHPEPLGISWQGFGMRFTFSLALFSLNCVNELQFLPYGLLLLPASCGQYTRCVTDRR